MGDTKATGQTNGHRGTECIVDAAYDDKQRVLMAKAHTDEKDENTEKDIAAGAKCSYCWRASPSGFFYTDTVLNPGKCEVWRLVSEHQYEKPELPDMVEWHQRFKMYFK